MKSNGIFSGTVLAACQKLESSLGQKAHHMSVQSRMGAICINEEEEENNHKIY